MNDLQRIELDNVQDVLKQIEDAFFDIPFENSEFQNKAFVLAAQLTPARAYRALGLRMHSKIQAVREYMFKQKMNQIDIEEKEAKIADPTTDAFERRRLQLSLSQLVDGDMWGKKLLNDALRELDVLYAEFQKYPRYTRAEFEREEPQHFELKLNRARRNDGAMESLLNMHEDLPKLDSIVHTARLMIESSRKELPDVGRSEDQGA